MKTPAGREGRPSKALTVEQAQALVMAAAGVLRANGMRKRRGPYRLHGYVVLLLATGIRPEEARALRWDLVDLEAGTVSVWRSDWAGGDTKTARSRRTLKLARIAVEALTARKAIQAADRLKAGELWQDDDLVFTTATGVMLDQRNIRREFRLICKAAGLGTDWVPRELRHTFVSIMSQAGMPVEEIARLAFPFQLDHPLGRGMRLSGHQPCQVVTELRVAATLPTEVRSCLRVQPRVHRVIRLALHYLTCGETERSGSRPPPAARRLSGLSSVDVVAAGGPLSRGLALVLPHVAEVITLRDGYHHGHRLPPSKITQPRN